MSPVATASVAARSALRKRVSAGRRINNRKSKIMSRQLAMDEVITCPICGNEAPLLDPKANVRGERASYRMCRHQWGEMSGYCTGNRHEQCKMSKAENCRCWCHN